MKKAILVVLAFIFIIGFAIAQQNNGINYSLLNNNSSNESLSFYQIPENTSEKNICIPSDYRRKTVVYFGAKLGLNIANLYGINKSDDMKSKMGLNIGASFGFRFSDILSLGTEINYEQKGYKESIDSTSIDGFDLKITSKSKTRYNYLTIPLLLRISVGESSKFYFEIGPYLGLLMSAKQVNKTDYSIAGIKTSLDTVIDIKDHSNSMDYGVAVGAGFFIPFIKDRINPVAGIFAGIRYNIGIKSTSQSYVYEDDMGNEVEVADPDLRNSSFEINVGIRVPINK